MTRFAYWTLGTLIGLLSAVWQQPEWPLWPFLLALLLAAVGCYKQSSSALVLTMGVLCGICWALFNLKLHNSWQLPAEQWRTESEVTLRISAFSVSEPTRMRVEGCVIATESPLPAVSNNLLCRNKVRLYWYPQRGFSVTETEPEPLPIPQLGETWQFKVRLKPPTGTLNDGGYDYQKYLQRRGIKALGTIMEGHRELATPAWSIAAARLKIFHAFSRYHHSNLQAQSVLSSVDILLALALGERQWLTTERWQVLQRTGLAHLMAISGLHLTLVFASVWALFRLLLVLFSGVLYRCVHWPRPGFLLNPLALLLALPVAFTYAALAGFSVATVRALVLIVLFVVLRLTGERRSPLLVLLFAVLLLWVMDPRAWMDTGFWLSAGAVAAIFIWQWRWPQPQALGWRNKIAALWRLEVMLLIALTPLTVLFFNGVSWVAPATNLLVIPYFTVLVIPLLLLSLPFVWLEQEWAYGSLWRFIDFSLTPVLNSLKPVAEHSLSWSNIYGFSLLVPLLFFVSWRWWPGALRQRLQVSAALTVLCYPWLKPAPPADFAVHVLDVGQGNALVIQRGRKAIVVDAGPAFPSGFDMGEQVVIPFLHHHRLTPELLVITHRHQDHAGGFDALVTEFPQLVTLGSEVGDWQCQWGQVWQWQGVQLRMLAPLPGPSFGPNNDSCVLSLRYQQQRVLLAGDSEWFNELRLVGRYGNALQSELLLVPHHGSRNSSQEAFLDAVSPQFAVVSRGLANQFSMPHKETLTRYKERHISVYDTGIDGQVSFIWQPQKNEQEGFWRVEVKRPEGRTPWYHRLAPEAS
ncbi:DNA internalization-related competence protein ComEC/Rec2 [Aliidiomarina celeris]|uniref:DNA internalization-related competence protein ComEC/Rec2 n=1 Tax=Aliidiomarina celeris TaxID=2249428 RepID=UPI000DEACCB9|nr:DNA internalization-related competence protein ComEC/Rec2 [Aliidiomarina celeris]